ncbi:MAG: hypothetical protein WC631_02675 [Candidatus Paceibacterota bacterium]|jgi:hypothetical protein
MKFLVKSNFLNKQAFLISASSFCAILIICLTLFVNINKSDAYVIDSYTTGGDGSIYSVFVNSPVGTLYPGQQFYLQVSATANACSNHSKTFTLTSGSYSTSLSRDGVRCTDDTNIVTSGNRVWSNGDWMYYCPDYNIPMTFSNYSLGPFTSPTTAGNYSLSFNASISSPYDTNRADLSAHQNYTVACPAIHPTQIISPVYVGTPNSSGTDFSWYKLSNAVAYYAYRVSLAGFEYVVGIWNDVNPYYNSSLNAYSYTDTTQTFGSPSYRVVATLPSTNAISLSATPNVTCHGGVGLSWRPVYYSPAPPSQTFEIYRDNSLIATVDNVNISSDAITYTDNGVSAGSTYTYKVIAKNISGCSDSISNTVSVNYTNTCNITSTPAIPTVNASIDIGECESMDISWPEVEYAEYYKLYKDGNIVTPLKAVFGTSTTDTGLVPTDSHTYAIQAVNSVSSSSVSSFSSSKHSSISCLPSIVGGGCGAYVHNTKVDNISSSTDMTWKASPTTEFPISGGDGDYRYLWIDETDSRLNGEDSRTVDIPNYHNFNLNPNEDPEMKTVYLKIMSGYGVQEISKNPSCSVNVWSSATPINGAILSFSSPILYVNQSFDVSVDTRTGITRGDNNGTPVNLDQESLMYSWNGGETTTSSSSPIIFTTVGLHTISVVISGLLENNTPFIGGLSTTTNILLPAAPNVEI